MEHAKLFFRPDKPEPEDHGNKVPYDLIHIMPLGTQVLYPSGRVYMLQKVDYPTQTGLEYRWTGFTNQNQYNLLPHLKMYVLLESIELRM